MVMKMPNTCIPRSLFKPVHEAIIVDCLFCFLSQCACAVFQLLLIFNCSSAFFLAFFSFLCLTFAKLHTFLFIDYFNSADRKSEFL